MGSADEIMQERLEDYKEEDVEIPILTESDIPRLEAVQHVDWLIDLFANLARPLMIEEFIHGYKHGQEDLMEQLATDRVTVAGKQVRVG